MKKLIFCIIVLASTEALFPQTQYDLMLKSCDKLKIDDKKLNHIYNKVLRENKSNPRFLKKFRKAQKAWIVFRDAYTESIFPEEQSKYGSVFNMCLCNQLALITKERLRQLYEWTTGIEEGDVCTGSRKIKL